MSSTKTRSLLVISLFGIILVSNIYYAYSYIPPTNAYQQFNTSNDTVGATNYLGSVNLIGKNGLTVTGSNSSQTIYLTAPNSGLNTTYCPANYGFVSYNQTTNILSCGLLNQTGSSSSGGLGSYNQTLANDNLINSGGYKINFENGTGIDLNVKNSNSGNQVNVTISNAPNSFSYNSTSNQTSQATTSTATFVVTGSPIELTPKVTGNILIIFDGTATSSLSGDGCLFNIAYGTGPFGRGTETLAASGGTLISPTSVGAEFSTPEYAAIPITYTISNLNLHTTYWFEYAYHIVNAGTCSLRSSTLTIIEL